MSLVISLVAALNLVIAYWNARVCGKLWEGSKTLGGGLRVLAWCGASHSAVGFSSVFMILLGGIAYALGYLVEPIANGSLSLAHVFLGVALAVASVLGGICLTIAIIKGNQARAPAA